MSDDRILEFMAQVGDYMRTTDERAEQTNRNFERLITVMHNGFEWVNNQLSALNTRVDHLTDRVDHLTERVDHLTQEVKEIKQDGRELKTEVATINRRLNATFDQTGRLTEQAGETDLRVSRVEQAQEPTNAELAARTAAGSGEQAEISFLNNTEPHV